MANGKVITGYSKPWVAKYVMGTGSANPTYEDGMALARGVSVSVEPGDTGDGVNFYADNILAESVGGTFTSGTATFTIDGLKDEARKMIMGIPTDAVTTVSVGGSTVNVINYDDRMSIPYVGIGFVVRYMENGVTTYSPVVLTKVRFNPETLEANTQEEEIEFQTTELEATVLRDDSSHHAWKKIGADQDTEAKAEAVIQAILGDQLQ